MDLKKEFTTHTEETELNYSALLLAFKYLDDDCISDWFRDYITKAGIDIDKIYRDYDSDREKTERKILNSEYPKDPLVKAPTGSRSAKELFREGVDIMNDTSIGDIRLREYHERIKGWNFDRESHLPNKFVAELASLCRPQEIGRWKSFHRKILDTEVLIDTGLSPFIANDTSTTKDRLNYHIYAYAIARFLTHPGTSPPISISIQSPWGGGKTSLMKMVRDELDEKAFSWENNAEQERRSKATSPRITLRALKSFLKKRSHSDNKLKLPSPSSRLVIKPKVTIWFNAWKYENTEQVWSGLADSIVRGIVDRMIGEASPSERPFKREWFLLQLNLHLEGADNVLRWIISQSLTYLWHRISKWVWMSIATVGVSLTVTALGRTEALYGIPLSAHCAGFQCFSRIWR